MKALITGIGGFVGSHLAELLLKEKYEVHGLVRNFRTDLKHIFLIKDQLHLHECDITDFYALEQVLTEVKPDVIFHLAAQAFVPSSWRAPVETFNTNITGSLHLFEAVRKVGIDPVIQIACSSEEYGLVKEDEVPIKETNPLRPLSPYAVSKISMDYLGYQYFKSYGLKIIRTRGFNHTGPRRGEMYVVSNFAKQIAQIEQGAEPIMHVGNLEAKRDFTDVRDMVKAYLLAVQKGEPREVYNICSGQAHSIKHVLDMLLSHSTKQIEVKEDPKRLRPSDVPILLGDNTKFREKTGWQTTIPFEQTVKDTLDYWRDELKRQRRTNSNDSS